MKYKMYEGIQFNFTENETYLILYGLQRLPSPCNKGITQKNIQFKRALQSKKIKAIE